MAYRPRLTKDQQVQVAEIYKEGQSMEAIANTMGVGRSAVWHALLRQGVPVRTPGQGHQLPPAVVRRMVEMWDDGARVSEIMAETGKCRATVCTYLTEAERDIANAGQRHHMWKGGRVVDSFGYIRVLIPEDDPMYCMVNSQRYVLEHRLFMARALGRPIDKRDTVHHIDGNRQNNALDNLQLRVGRHGKGIRHQCLDCGSHNVAALPL
ncbi:MAG: HNH endonuclease [Chloroflexota bacterium]|nr:HNH endonuclease [Chloroflexota bacterium]